MVLQTLRSILPFLRSIPDEIYFSLDSSELYVPVGNVAHLRQELEQKLGHFVMTYKREVFNTTLPVKMHLCAHVKGAILSKRQLLLLQGYEKQVENLNVSFVVYQNPITFIEPQHSLLAAYYKYL